MPSRKTASVSRPPARRGARRGAANADRSRLDQVAALAGVSPATVSRALNRPELLSVATLSRVRAAVDRLQFVPHSGARALSSGRSRVIGALIPHIGYSVFAELMDAVQQQCTQAGYNLVIGIHHFDAEDELRQARQLVNSGVDALMLVGFRHHPDLFELLAARGVHYVCTDVFDPKSPHPSVGYDNRGIGRRIAAHLLGLGHREFAVVTGDTRRNDRMALRLAGFKAELRRHGVGLAEDALFEGDYTLADGRAGFAQVIATNPTAVVCGNDVIAVGALLEARDRGIAVPRQLSMIGFDNLEWASEYSPALTTVNVPCTSMGVHAAQALLARIAGLPVPHAVEIELDIVVRASTAAPREAGRRRLRA
jgi:LacI family transcriptional regulator